jgi:hypothetical protein
VSLNVDSEGWADNFWSLSVDREEWLFNVNLLGFSLSVDREGWPFNVTWSEKSLNVNREDLVLRVALWDMSWDDDCEEWPLPLPMPISMSGGDMSWDDDCEWPLPVSGSDPAISLNFARE